MKKIKKRTTAVTAAMLVLAMALGGCGQTADESETAQEESAVTVSTKRVETGTITLTNSFVGVISPQETVMVIPLTAGTVAETFFEVGDEVKAGDVLFKIDDEAARLQYQTAKLNVQNAKQTADSTMENLLTQRDTTMENLLNQQDSTDLQLESSKMQAQSSFESAQIGYVTAKDNYEKLDKMYSEAKKQYESMASNMAAEVAKLEAMKAAASEAGQAISGQSDIEDSDSGEDAEDSDAQKSEMSDNGNSGNYNLQRDVSATDEIAGLEKEIEKAEKELTTQYSTVTSLETSRSQAYQAYLSARSGYHTAEKAIELTAETEAMTRDQLAQTMKTTEDQLAQSIESTEDQLALSLDMAQLSVAQAELALDYYTVTAPVSGVIESKGVEENGIASQGSPAYTIVNNNTMTVTFQVSEDVRNTLSVGQNVTLERNNHTYTASITEIGASVNPQSGLFQIKACAEVSGAELPNGVSVKVSADTYRAENEMIIPYEAVYYDNEGAYVYTSVNGRAVKTPIETGIFDDDNIVVTGGLNLGDIVVTSWSPQLTGGVLLRAAE